VQAVAGVVVLASLYVLLGVGYGSAPLFALAARLRERGCSIDYLLGGDSADRVFGALTARRNGRSAAGLPAGPSTPG